MYNGSREEFGAKDCAIDDIEKHSSFDFRSGTAAWRLMIAKADGIGNFLECGCNIGRNVKMLGLALPDAKPSVFEISKPAFDFVSKTYKREHAFHDAIFDSNLRAKSSGLVFTMGVLIHINPEQLLDHMNKMHDDSRKHVLTGVSGQDRQAVQA